MKEVVQQFLFWIGVIITFTSFLLPPAITPIALVIGLLFTIIAFFSGVKSAKRGAYMHMTMLKIQRFMIVIVFLVGLLFFLLVQRRQISEANAPLWFYMLLGINGLFVIFLIIMVIKITSKRSKMFVSYKGLVESEKMLDNFIKSSIKQGFAYSKIKESAVKAGWPIKAFNERFGILKSDDPEFVIEKLIKNYKLEILKKYIERALSNNFTEAEVKSAALNLNWPLEIINQAIDEVRHVTPSTTPETHSEGDDTPETTGHEPIIKLKLVDYETDFDKLYKIVKERGKLKLSEVASTFNISKIEAQNWANILVEHKLLEIYYPAFGEAELRWKK